MAKKTKKRISSKKTNTRIDKSSLKALQITSKSALSKRSKLENNSKKETIKQIADNSIRGEDGKLLPGVVLNPNGRPKGSKNKFSIKELAQAIEKVEQREKIGFLEAWVELAWGDVVAMGNIVQYMLPKLRSIEMSGDVGTGKLSQEALKSIQEILKKSYGT